MVGLHPETKEPIEAAMGRFGPYVKMGSMFGSLDRDDDVLALGLNRAMDLIAKKHGQRPDVWAASRRTRNPWSCGKAGSGPMCSMGKMVANLPRGTAMDDVTLEKAVALLAEKGKTLKPRGAAAKKGRAKASAKAGAEPRRPPAAEEGGSGGGAEEGGAARSGRRRPQRSAGAGRRRWRRRREGGAKKAKGGAAR